MASSLPYLLTSEHSQQLLLIHFAPDAASNQHRIASRDQKASTCRILTHAQRKFSEILNECICMGSYMIILWVNPMFYHQGAPELHVQCIKLRVLNSKLTKSLTKLPVYVCEFTEFSIILEAITKLEQPLGGYKCIHEQNDRKAPCSDLFAKSRYLIYFRRGTILTLHFKSTLLHPFKCLCSLFP